MIKTRGGRLAPFNMMASSRVSADLPPKPFDSMGDSNMENVDVTSDSFFTGCHVVTRHKI
jgi:hypothetical protein